MRWQPIETAPKDGTVILAATENKTYPGWETLRFPYPFRQTWQDEKWVCATEGIAYRPQPTHWVPVAAQENA